MAAPSTPDRARALAAVGTGVCRWDQRAGTVELDAEAARLLGLPAEPAALPVLAVRARFHAEDFVELGSLLSLARAEESVAEAPLRVMDEDGQVARVVRLRLRPLGRDRAAGELLGTVQEELPSPAAPRGEAGAAGARAAGDRRRAREAFLLDAGRALAEADSTDEVLRVTTRLSMPGFTPDGLIVFGRSGDRLTVIGQHGYPRDYLPPSTMVSMDADHPAAQVVRTGRAVYVSSREEYVRRFPRTWPLVRRFGRASWAFVPLVAGGHTIGAWMAAFAHPVAFTSDERAVLTTIARLLAHALERARVHESERALSDGLQRAMLPVRAPGIPGMALAARYVPTGGGLQVGGDWYDVIPLPSGRTAVVIGDVQGHDVHAAGVMSQLRIALRAYAAEGHRPDAVLSRACRFLAGLETDRFATCLYVEIDPERATLDLARAGHLNPSVRLGDGTCVVREVPGGLPLGVLPEDDYPVSRLVLEPGEVLLVCTDGLVEAGGHDLDSGRRRIHRVLGGSPSASLDAVQGLEELADCLVGAVHGPASHHAPGPLADRREDDIALVLLHRESGTAPSPARRIELVIAQAETRRVAEVRANVRATLRDWARPELVDTAELLVSEVLTNVLVHTDSDALLCAELTGPPGRSRLRVEIVDSGDQLPHRRTPGELASSGRGLLLLDALADAWGVEPSGTGKTTWFELLEHR
ncbi:ATP-binding SpoIIE family protein phosphatase [Streptomyces capparidis]